MLQHALAARLFYQCLRQVQPERCTTDRNLEHRAIGLADQITVTGCITTHALEIQITTTHQRGKACQRTQLERQIAVRRRCVNAVCFCLPGILRHIKAVQHIVVTVGNGPQLAIAHGQTRQIAADHVVYRVLGLQFQDLKRRGENRRGNQGQGGEPGSYQVRTSARLPFDSSQDLRSPARFFASNMSIISDVAAKSSSVSCTRRRVFGSMVVSRSCGGFISPRQIGRAHV